MLDAHSAYKLRLIAHNAQGVAASDVAGPFFTGLGARSIMAQYVVKRVASGVFWYNARPRRSKKNPWPG